MYVQIDEHMGIRGIQAIHKESFVPGNHVTILHMLFLAITHVLRYILLSCFQVETSKDI